jgi:hypothetical protein
MSEGDEPILDRDARHRPESPDRPHGEEPLREDRPAKRHPDQAVHRRKRGRAPETKKAATARLKRRPPRRWIKRLVVLAVVLLVLIVGVVQIILATGLPRKMVLRMLEQQLGLRVGARTLATGWGGHSTLDDVTLTLPLAEEAFFTMPRLEVNHTNLPMLLIGRPVRIQEIRLESPRLVVRQDPLGRWNVYEAVALITRAAGGKSADVERKSASGKAVALPKLTLSKGTLVLTDRHGKSATLSPLEIHGQPHGSLAWHFEGRIGEEIEITDGRIAPGQNWSHQAKIVLRELGQILKPWAKNFPRPFELAG